MCIQIGPTCGFIIITGPDEEDRCEHAYVWVCLRVQVSYRVLLVTYVYSIPYMAYEPVVALNSGSTQ